MTVGRTLVDFFGDTSVFLLFAWFCSSVMENRRPVLSTLLGIALYGQILPVITSLPVFVENVPSPVRYAIIMLSFWAYTWLGFRGTFREKVVSYCLGYSIISVAQVVVGGILMLVGVDPQEQLEWLMAGSVSFAFAIMFMVSKVWRSVSFILRQKNAAVLFLLPVLQFLLIAVIIFLVSKNYETNYFFHSGSFRGFMIAISVVFVLSMLVDGLVIDSIRSMADSITAQEQLKTLELENRMTYEYVKAMESDIEEMRRYRHDMLNMLAAVQLSMESGGEGREQAQEMVSQLTKEISSITGKHYCECNIVNCILALEEKKLTEAGITSRIRAAVPQTLSVSELDFCRVVSNIFDNAREACLRESEGSRWVEAAVEEKEGFLYITVSNGCTGRELQLTTRKKGKKEHGHGLAILREITGRSGGDLLIDHNADSVRVTAVMGCGQSR